MIDELNQEKEFVFDDVKTHYEHEPETSDNEKESTQTVSLFEWMYENISHLGHQTIHYTKLYFSKIIKFIGYPLLQLFEFIKFCLNYFITFLSKANKNVIEESNNFFNDVKVAKLLIKQNKTASKHQHKNSFALLRDFFKIAVKKHHRFLKHSLNYVLPLLMLICCTAVLNIYSNINFALDVKYNDVHIGYIANENVFREAQEILEKRLEIGGQEFDDNFVSQPEYKISVVKLNELSDSNEICEQIIANSDSGLTTACGVYVDNKFIGSVKNESDASSVFKSFISDYSDANNIDPDDSQVIIDLVENVSYVQGLYSEKTLMDSTELKNHLTSHNKSEVSKYTVKDDDTADSICENNNLTREQFFAINPDIDPEQDIKDGTSVNVIKNIPFINVSVSESTTEFKEIEYKTVEIKTNSLYQGVKRVISDGENGQQKVVTLTTYINGQKISSKVISSTITKEPVDKKIYVGTKPMPSSVTIYGTQSGAFVWPVVGANTVTSGFGYRYIFGKTSFHRGVDISGPGANGKPVIASAAGVVEKVTQSNSGYGYSVLIDHGNGIKTRYAHCQAGSIIVRVGQSVAQGQMVARLGNTGNSTGPHLHFEIIYNGSYANPMNYVTR